MDGGGYFVFEEETRRSEGVQRNGPRSLLHLQRSARRQDDVQVVTRPRRGACDAKADAPCISRQHRASSMLAALFSPREQWHAAAAARLRPGADNGVH